MSFSSFRYVNRDREITKKYVQHAEKRGVKAVFITVDAPQLGRREKDMRMKFVDDGAGAKVQEGQSGVKKDQGVARAISVCFLSINLNNLVFTSFQVFHRPQLVLEGYSMVQEHNQQ